MEDDHGPRLALLESRVDQLEAELTRMQATVDAAAPAFAPSLPPPPIGPPVSAPIAPPPPAPIPTPTPAAASRGPLVDSETALKWGGVGLVVLAVAFAVSTAVRRGWIGPELQLLGAVAVSLALIGVGLRLRPIRMPWTHALCAGGVVALYTTVASNLFIDQLGDDVALTSTVVIGVLAYGLARYVPSEWVASVTLLGGAIGWLTIADGDLTFYPSLAWAVVLVVLALGLSLLYQWFALRLLAHIVGVLAVLPAAGGVEGALQPAVALLVAGLLFAALVWLPSAGDLESIWQRIDVQFASVAALVVFAAIALALDLDTDLQVGFTALAVAAASAAVAVAVRPRVHDVHFVSILLGASITLSIGLGTLLPTSAAFVAFAVQGAGLIVLGRVLGSWRVLANAAGTMVVAAVFVTGAMIGAWFDDANLIDDVAYLAVIAALAVAIWQTQSRFVYRWGYVAILVLVLGWLGSVLVHLPQGQAVVSVSWAAVGTALLVAGALRKVPDLARAGLAVLALTVAKLLTVDLQEVDTLWRAGLFFVVGLGILRLGFLLPRLTGHGEVQPRA